MWNWIIRARLKALAARNTPPNSGALENAKSVLFAVFARYGDSVIAFKAINEFITRYPEKQYLLITTHQALPYAEALIRVPLEMVSVNKRRNPFRMWRLTRRLRRQAPDIGFNPWSHGEESEYFGSFCAQFQPYRVFANFTRDQNLYRRVRDYLQLPDPAVAAPKPLPPRAACVILCPFSTDVRKSLDATDFGKLLATVKQRFGNPRIILAGLPHELAGTHELGIEQFVFGKTPHASRRFIALLRETDLFIGVDAGPLHLADALGIRCVGIFGPTAPETILDRNSSIVPLRHAKLAGVFCDVRRCNDPLCLHELLATLDFDRPAPVDFKRPLRLEEQRCAMDAGRWGSAEPDARRSSHK